jgi:hypothetical protein
MSLWKRCAGGTHIRPLEVTPWRVVETQEKAYTRKLVDSNEELDLLEELIESSKPAIDRRIYQQYHYLLFSPFRYPPLRHGSRFGSIIEPSLWYGALKIETALTEVAYYRLLFLQDTKADLKLNIPLSAYSVKAFSENAVDLTAAPFHDFRDSISSPITYAVSQPLGTAMRHDSVELFLYYSARTATLEHNVGVFYPKVFIKKKLLQEPFSWSCYADKNVVEFRHIGKSGQEEKVICRAEVFQHNGKLSYPETALSQSTATV